MFSGQKAYSKNDINSKPLRSCLKGADKSKPLSALIEGTLLALITALVWGTGDFLSRKPSAIIGSMLTSILIQPVGLGIMILVLLASNVRNQMSTMFSDPLYLVLNLSIGVIAFIGIVLLYRGYYEGVMSIVAPIAGAFPVVAVALSVLLLGTALTPIKSFAIVGAIAGIILAGIKLSSFKISRSSRSGFGLDRSSIIKGADYGAGAMLCAGIGLFVLGVVSPVIGSILAVVLLKLVETITAGCLLLIGRIKLVKPSLPSIAWVLIIGACDACGFVTYNLAINAAGGDIPIVVTLAGLIGVVTVLLARVFYKEKLEKIQLAGIAVIFIAVATILYF